jgi:hypothetical protein
MTDHCSLMRGRKAGVPVAPPDPGPFRRSRQLIFQRIQISLRPESDPLMHRKVHQAALH